VRAIDTNVLLRFIVNDEPQQAEHVARFLRECRAEGELVFISVPVLCELVWVLERIYGEPKPPIVNALNGLLELDFLRFDQPFAVRRAFEQYRRGRAHFADYLIGELAMQAGCLDTVTFDRGLRGAPGFTILRTP
jgi:predicted nucleic-acid-binding protein